ncbi:MAG: hypothetical protein F7C35_06110 [Desulfurococcales archaeon]|nr:hypothetical protein [Desulfurococcales archaeon]
MIVVVNNKALARHLYNSITSKKRRGRSEALFNIRIGTAIPDKCLICQGDIALEGKVVLCPYCGSVYHFSCLKTLADESGIPLEELECIYCGNKLPLREILAFTGER